MLEYSAGSNVEPFESSDDDDCSIEIQLPFDIFQTQTQDSLSIFIHFF